MNRLNISHCILRLDKTILCFRVYGHRFYLVFKDVPEQELLNGWFDDIMGILGIGAEKQG